MRLQRAEFIAIGSELLEPWRHDTNGSYLALRLGERGIPLRFRTVVGDTLADLEDLLRAALARSDLIVATGGLGPTVDDLTRDAVAAVLGLKLIEDAAIVREIELRFERFGRKMGPRNRVQALVPEGAEVLPNPVGSAPGLLLRAGGALLALLPGVPHEMRRMVDESLLPRLGPVEDRFVHRVFRIAGLTESEVDERLAAVHRGAGEVGWTILAGPGQIEIHLRERVAAGSRATGIETLDRRIEAALGEALFARDSRTMEEVVGERLLRSGGTLATAESITGGGIAQRLTSVPGASRYFRGGIVCYSDDAKIRVLGVRAETLATSTAVSAETAVAMADAVRRLFGAAWGLSATGYAGPEGGPGGEPPGRVHLGISGPAGASHLDLRLPGEREGVRERAAQAALDLLRRRLAERPA
jgi:competence/damage-inducible protein CinA-like protein